MNSMFILVVLPSAYHSSTGSGYNRLCLPRDPGFGFQHYDSDSDTAETYGAEYETGNAPSAQSRTVANSPIPCAVCEAVRGSVLQVSGTRILYLFVTYDW